MSESLLTQDELKRSLSYDRDTGVFIWKDPTKYHWNLVGKEAGCVRVSRGRKYRWIRLRGRYYSAHRLAWFYCYGHWPHMIDHKSGDSLDNRIDNMNDVSQFLNAQNHILKPKANGLPAGVRITSSGRFDARIKVRRKPIHLGVFDTPQEASKAYTEARKTYHYCPAEVQNESL